MLKTAKKIWANEFFKGSVYFLLTSFLVNLLNYIFNFMIGRGLGPKGYGEISTMFSYTNIALTPTVVFSSYIIKKIGEKTANELPYVVSIEQSFKLRMKKIVWLFLALILIVPLISSQTNLSLETSFTLIILVFLGYFGSFYNGALPGLRYFFAFSLFGIITALIKLLGAFSILISLNSLLIILFFLILSSVFFPVVSYYYLKAKVAKISGLKIRKISRNVISVFKNRNFQLIFLSTLSLTFLNNADVIYVKKYLTSFEAGIYASWSIFSKLILYALGPLISISFIFYSAKSQSSNHSLTLKLSLIILFLVFFVSYVIYSFFPQTLINIFFGNKFNLLLPFLSYASVFGALYAVLVYLNNYYLAKESKAALILPLFTPLYLLGLFLIKKNILNVIRLNIFFSLGIILLYFSIYLKDKLRSYF